jgi:glucokinase
MTGGGASGEWLTCTPYPSAGRHDARMAGSLAVGIDIGGTKVAAGVVDEAGGVIEQVRRDTPSTSPMAT